MTETRAWVSSLEIRSGGDGRTIVGLAAPFDQPAQIQDFQGRYTESIQRGAFARTIAERGAKVKLLVQHDAQRLPIGRATSLREDTAGLVAELRVSNTAAGNDALELVRDGILDGLSIGFRAVRDTWSPDRSRRTLQEIRLDEISIVGEAAYDAAKVLAVRSGTHPSLELAYAQLALRQKDIP